MTPELIPTALQIAAQAVLDRWNSPKWEWLKQGPTGELMANLYTAITQPEQRERVPAEIAVARIFAACDEADESTAQPVDAGEVQFPLMCKAFRTTISQGLDKRYEMVFAFPDLAALHAADTEWLNFRKAAIAQPEQPAVSDAEVEAAIKVWMTTYGLKESVRNALESFAASRALPKQPTAKNQP